MPPILQNYESEYQKVENIAQILTQMISEYKDKLQKRLLDSMIKERNLVN